MPDGRRDVRPVRWGRWALAVVIGMPLFFVAFVATQVALAAGRDDRGAVDAIVVLGAAQFDGEPSPALQRRLDRAAALWNDGVAPRVVVTGGKQPGDRVTEGLAGFLYLRRLGLPEDALLVEVDSRNTYEQLSATRLILAERGLERAVLVSDPYHNRRLLEIAAEVGLDAGVSATDGGLPGGAFAREVAAVTAGRLVGYRRLSSL